jgi:hypothetical protein
MINSLFFIFFYFLCFYIGRGIVIIFEFVLKQKFLEYKFFGIPLYIFYPIIYLFFVGNVVMIANFFTKGFNIIVFIISTIPLVFNLFQKRDWNKQLNIFSITTLFILGLSTNNITFHQDAASYHLSHQQFIRTEKIVLGMANLHVRYGFSSMSEYVNSFFWINNNFIIVHFVNLIFISTFYLFFIWIIYNSKNFSYRLAVLSISLYGVLDNFGIEGGKNGYFDIDTIGKQDGAFAVLFFFSNFFIIKQIISSKKYKNENLLFILLLVTFAIQYRIFGFLSLVGVSIIVFQNFKKINFKVFLFPLILGIVWSVKNYLTTSCLIFPVAFSCLPSLWSNKYLAILQNEELRFFHKAYNINSESIFEWYFKWSDRYLNYYISINLFVSLLIIILFLHIFFKFSNKNNGINFFIFIYVLFLLIAWMLSAPSIRFGSGIFILIISSYSLFFSDLRFPKLDKLFSQKSMLLLLVFLTVFSTPLFDNYKNVESNIELRKIEPMYLVYEKNLNNWGEQVKNIDGQDIEFCWINKNCIPPNNNRIEEFDMFSYRVMKVVNK